MSGTAGLLCRSADEARSIFLGREDLDGLLESIELVLGSPTVAGPDLDLAGLQRLSRALELADVAVPGLETPAVVLSPQEQAALELLWGQAAIRLALPLRVRRTCVDCGQERIINPARPRPGTAVPQQDQSGRLGSALAASVDLFTEGHPFLATLNLLGGLADDEPSPLATAEPCERCDGDAFDLTVITFCPGCREIRAETVLVRCPDCDFDFATRRPPRDLWTGADAADRARRQAANRALLTSRAGEFENGLRAGQLAALTGAVTGDERLLALCRCGLRGELGRYVALLFTSDALVWARESAMSATTTGRIRWAEVTGIQPTGLGRGPVDWGIQVDVPTGSALAVRDFKGAGVSLDGGRYGFDARGIHHLAHHLWGAARGPGEPVTGPAPPAARTPAGWYPDPWRQAPLRWWDGSRWTPATR